MAPFAVPQVHVSTSLGTLLMPLSRLAQPPFRPACAAPPERNARTRLCVGASQEPPEHRDRKAQLRVEWKALPLAEKFRMAYAWREHEQRELSAKEDKRWRAEASRASGAFRAIEAWLDAG